MTVEEREETIRGASFWVNNISEYIPSNLLYDTEIIEDQVSE
jgi:hypothetical protein